MDGSVCGEVFRCKMVGEEFELEEIGNIGPRIKPFCASNQGGGVCIGGGSEMRDVWTRNAAREWHRTLPDLPRNTMTLVAIKNVLVACDGERCWALVRRAECIMKKEMAKMEWAEVAATKTKLVSPMLTADGRLMSTSQPQMRVVDKKMERVSEREEESTPRPMGAFEKIVYNIFVGQLCSQISKRAQMTSMEKEFIRVKESVVDLEDKRDRDIADAAYLICPHYRSTTGLRLTPIEYSRADGSRFEFRCADGNMLVVHTSAVDAEADRIESALGDHPHVRLSIRRFPKSAVESLLPDFPFKSVFRSSEAAHAVVYPPSIASLRGVIDDPRCTVSLRFGLWLQILFAATHLESRRVIHPSLCDEESISFRVDGVLQVGNLVGCVLSGDPRIHSLATGRLLHVVATGKSVTIPVDLSEVASTMSEFGALVVSRLIFDRDPVRSVLRSVVDVMNGILKVAERIRRTTEAVRRIIC